MDDVKFKRLQFAVSNYSALERHYPGKNLEGIATEIYAWYTDPEIEVKLEKALKIIGYGQRKNSMTNVLQDTDPFPEEEDPELLGYLKELNDTE